MMCESAKHLYMHSWLNMLINDFQVSGGCGEDGDWIKMNPSCDPLDLLPDDPFGMNEGSISTISAGGIESTTDDYDLSSGDPFVAILEKMINDSQESGGCGRVEDCVEMNSSCDPIELLPTDPFAMNVVSEIDTGKRISGIIEWWTGDSDYYRGKPVLSTSETLVKSAIEANKVGVSEPALDATDEGNFQDFWAVEETSSSGSDFSESFPNVTGYESFGASEDMNEVLVLVSDKGLSGSVLEVARERCFRDGEDAEEFLHSTGRRDGDHPDGDVNCLQEGLHLSLGYLGVRDLLSVEMVSRSLRSAVQNDPLLWRFIHIDSSLGLKITDDDLYRLTQRAQGNLRCLILAQCSNITFDGLKRVLDSNPMLKKLNVPQCIRQTADGLINNLNTSELSEMPGINSLKPAAPFIRSVQDLEELRSIVAGDEPLLTKARKLHFFHDENCRSKGPDHCRPCCACIQRCADCGRCIENFQYVETFLLNNICSDCVNRASEDPGIPEDNSVDGCYKKFF